MNLYQQHLANQLLSSTHQMIHHLPQPVMFGGKRERDYVMTGETDYGYPSTLGVGTHGYQMHTVGGKKYTTKSFVKDVSTLGKLIPKSTRQAITDKANEKIEGAGKRRGRPPKRPVEEWFEGGALSSRALSGDEYTSYPKALMSVQGGKKYTTKSFVKDVSTLGKLIPKSTREAMTAKANEKIAGGKKYTTKSFVKDVNTLGKLIPKSTRQAITDKTNEKIAGAGRGRPKTERGELIKKIMSEMGVSLGQASKIIKEKGLY